MKEVDQTVRGEELFLPGTESGRIAESDRVWTTSRDSIARYWDPRNMAPTADIRTVVYFSIETWRYPIVAGQTTARKSQKLFGETKMQ